MSPTVETGLVMATVVLTEGGGLVGSGPGGCTVTVMPVTVTAFLGAVKFRIVPLAKGTSTEGVAVRLGTASSALFWLPDCMTSTIELVWLMSSVTAGTLCVWTML